MIINIPPKKFHELNEDQQILEYKLSCVPQRSALGNTVACPPVDYTKQVHKIHRLFSQNVQLFHLPNNKINTMSMMYI